MNEGAGPRPAARSVGAPSGVDGVPSPSRPAAGLAAPALGPRFLAALRLRPVAGRAPSPPPLGRGTPRWTQPLRALRGAVALKLACHSTRFS